MSIFIFIAILFLIDVYVFQALKLVTSHRWIYIVYWGMTILALSFFLILRFSGTRLFNRQFLVFFGCFILANYFSKLVALFFLVIDDIWRLFKWVINFFKSLFPNTNILSQEQFSLSRSEFLAKLGLGLSAVPTLALTWGIVSGAHDYRIRRQVLYFKNLPHSFHGLKILQLSDIHSGSFWNKTAVKRGVKMALDEKPDIFFFTGDLVNNEAVEMENYFEVFKVIDAPLGCYSILGNHDYGEYKDWESKQAKAKNLEDIKTIHKEMGWQLLLNENKLITVNEESIALIGVENWGAGRFSKYGNIEKAYQGCENQLFKILLSHDPTHWEVKVISDKRFQDIDLTLSGHTHGMQFGVKIGNFEWSPVKYRYKYWAGLYQNNLQYLYVNRGFGYIGYPGRIGMLPEITIIELKSTSAYF